jgi:hypothetical protein
MTGGFLSSAEKGGLPTGRRYNMEQMDWANLAFTARLHRQGVTLDWKWFNEAVSHNRMSVEAKFEWVNDYDGFTAINIWRKYDYPSEIEKNTWPQAYQCKEECFYNLQNQYIQNNFEGAKENMSEPKGGVINNFNAPTQVSQNFGKGTITAQVWRKYRRLLPISGKN